VLLERSLESWLVSRAATAVSDTGELASRENRPRSYTHGAASTTARSSQTAAANQSMMAESTGWLSAEKSTETTPEAMTIVHDAGGNTSDSRIVRSTPFPGLMAFLVLWLSWSYGFPGLMA
jgi:hypothetical protein